MLFVSDRSLRPAIGWAAGLGALWIVVAIVRPGTTFHLAPLLVGGAAPLLAALDRAPRPQVVTLAVMSGALSLAITAALAALGAMNGPPLEPFPSPVVEALVLSVAGAVGGAAVGIAIRR